MKRIALGIAYAGEHFHGWQKQPTMRTVQSCLEQALSRIANTPIKTICAGRTDAGVHAIGQIVHFDIDDELKRDEQAWVLGTNTYLPADVRVRWVKQVPDTFHARFSATARYYQYWLYNHSVAPCVLRHACSWHAQPLNETHMIEAARTFIGKHDFVSFRSSLCQAKTTVRHITDFRLKRFDDFVVFDIRANAFLHHMVRNLVGVLLDIGEGKQPVSWAQQVLEAKDRAMVTVMAPPQGLHLMEVTYPEEFDLPTKNDSDWLTLSRQFTMIK